MKILETIREEKNEGLLSLIGKEITFFCMSYIYAGKLIGVNDTCVKLENPKIVYETGDFKTKTWKDAQPLPNVFYLQVSAIEGFGEVK